MSIRVVLADDHRMLREGLRRSMSDAGFQVVGEASDGIEAVELADRLSPDVIIMDVAMPVCDGVEACRQLTAAGAPTRVVMLTMHGEPGIEAEALAAGAAVFLHKDCSTSEIAEAVLTAAGAGPTGPGGGRTSPGRRSTSGRLGVQGQVTRRRAERTELTRREVEVLQLIADGRGSTQVAQELFISPKTVKNHLASIYQKLDVPDRTQAVLEAVRTGLVSLHPLRATGPDRASATSSEMARSAHQAIGR